MKLIDKSALVAEIERKINEIDLDSIEDWRYRIQRERDIEVMKNILSLINTLEVKEVNLSETFIEKACEFIKERIVFEDNTWYTEGEITLKDKVIEDFKNYMKRE